MSDARRHVRFKWSTLNERMPDTCDSLGPGCLGRVLVPATEVSIDSGSIVRLPFSRLDPNERFCMQRIEDPGRLLNGASVPMGVLSTEAGVAGILPSVRFTQVAVE
jgi:hypothetical protein